MRPVTVPSARSSSSDMVVSVHVAEAVPDGIVTVRMSVLPTRSPPEPISSSAATFTTRSLAGAGSTVTVKVTSPPSSTCVASAEIVTAGGVASTCSLSPVQLRTGFIITLLLCGNTLFVLVRVYPPVGFDRISQNCSGSSCPTSSQMVRTVIVLLLSSRVKCRVPETGV